LRKNHYLTDKDLQEAFARAKREFSDGRAKVSKDNGQLFREAGSIDNSGV
jgi:hypothetical protein